MNKKSYYKTITLILGTVSILALDKYLFMQNTSPLIIGLLGGLINDKIWSE